jgi:RimJ/RimL family protein N-acetyltransferase
MALVPLPERIKAEGLLIRRVQLSDVDTLHEAVTRNREYLTPWVGGWVLKEPVSLEERRREVEEWITGYALGQGHPLLIEEDGQFVGMTGLHDRNEPRDVEVGYWVNQCHQGRGIATRATRALCALALADPGVDRVLLRHLVENRASRRIPEKLGFTLLDAAEPHDGQIFVLWAMRRGETLD